MVTEDLVRETLKTVYDPELGVDIMNLGMIYDVKIEDEGKKVTITMTLTTLGCPLYEELNGEIRDKVGSISGVEDVDVKLVFDPPWTPEFMSEEAKLIFRYMF